MPGIKIGIVQIKPVHLNLKLSVERAVEIISEANDCDLIVFGEPA